MAFTTRQRDRAAGTLVASAVSESINLGDWGVGTRMAVPLLQAIAMGKRISQPPVVAEIVTEWRDVACGDQSRTQQNALVLSALPEKIEYPAVLDVSRTFYEETGRDDAGALGRAAVLALGFLQPDDTSALTLATRQFTELTHGGEDSQDACVILGHTIREGIISGRFDPLAQVVWVAESRRDEWRKRIEIALRADAVPAAFVLEGESPVGALQAAIAIAATTTGELTQNTIEHALQQARALAGSDVAAAAGAIIGALHGVKRLPDEWLKAAHRQPILTVAGLAELAHEAIGASVSDEEWDGGDLNAMIKRLEHRVVSWKRSIAHVTDFQTAEELATWLNKCAAEMSSSAAFEVWALHATPLPEFRRNPKDYVFLGKDHFHSPQALGGVPEACEGQQPRLFAPINFHPGIGVHEWFSSVLPDRAESAMSANFEGDLLAGMHNTYSIAFDEVRPLFDLSDGPTAQELSGWCLVKLANTNAALPVPLTEAVLEVNFDNDGAAMSLRVVYEPTFIEHSDLQAAFAGDWARWLTDSVVLTEQELAEGTSRAESLVVKTIEEEAFRAGAEERRRAMRNRKRLKQKAVMEAEEIEE